MGANFVHLPNIDNPDTILFNIPIRKKLSSDLIKVIQARPDILLQVLDL